ncbi:hypothetical protein K2173_023541 [Erythroxylum novogranatense]|uniref:Retrotransposon Copia-like N-terminal domain-containing protein n=1 Tax=Erythroxylum novogranatense TaxID=1862640 RepID=A0AAV8TNU2_9ROSI|nr:hypothetical protein K2173_023541 [Erythroxylum novogranatense]
MNPSSSIPTTSYNPPPSIIVQQDNSIFPTSVVLDETNFSLWSQLMEMRIGARNKIGYLTGEMVKPATNDSSYATWTTDNNKVKIRLIDSMSPHLLQRFIRLATAKEIWEAVAKTFYDGSNETCLFELNQKSFMTKQNGQPLPTYYNELVANFQEIDHRMAMQENTTTGVVHMHSVMARLRVHIFLSGLGAEFDQVRGEILRKDPKLDLENTYAYVRREAQLRQIMGNSRPLKVVARSSAEAEFRGMTHGLCELLWIKGILQDLGIEGSIPISLFCDNKAAIQIAQNLIQHDKTKHVEVDHHFIKEKLDQRLFSFHSLSTRANLQISLQRQSQVEHFM